MSIRQSREYAIRGIIESGIENEVSRDEFHFYNYCTSFGFKERMYECRDDLQRALDEVKNNKEQEINDKEQEIENTAADDENLAELENDLEHLQDEYDELQSADDLLTRLGYGIEEFDEYDNGESLETIVDLVNQLDSAFVDIPTGYGRGVSDLNDTIKNWRESPANPNNGLVGKCFEPTDEETLLNIVATNGFKKWFRPEKVASELKESRLLPKVWYRGLSGVSGEEVDKLKATSKYSDYAGEYYAYTPATAMSYIGDLTNGKLLAGFLNVPEDKLAVLDCKGSSFNDIGFKSTVAEQCEVFLAFGFDEEPNNWQDFDFVQTVKLAKTKDTISFYLQYANARGCLLVVDKDFEEQEYSQNRLAEYFSGRVEYALEHNYTKTNFYAWNLAIRGDYWAVMFENIHDFGGNYGKELRGTIGQDDIICVFAPNAYFKEIHNKGEFNPEDNRIFYSLFDVEQDFKQEMQAEKEKTMQQTQTTATNGGFSLSKNIQQDISGSPEIVSVTRDNYAAANRYAQNAAKNPIFLEKIDNHHQPVMPFDDFVAAVMKDTGDSRDEVVELASEAFRSQYQAASGYLRGVSDGSVMYNAFDIEMDDKTYYATAPLEWVKEQARVGLSDRGWDLENALHNFLHSSLENNQWETAFHQLKDAADEYKKWRNQVCAFFNFRQPEITLQQGEWTQVAQFVNYNQEWEQLDNARLLIAEFTPQQALEFHGLYAQYMQYQSLVENNAQQGVDTTHIDKQIAALEQSLNEKVAQNLPLIENRQVMFDLFGTQLGLFDEETQEQGVSASENGVERQPESQSTDSVRTLPENAENWVLYYQATGKMPIFSFYEKPKDFEQLFLLNSVAMSIGVSQKNFEKFLRVVSGNTSVFNPMDGGLKLASSRFGSRTYPNWTASELFKTYGLTPVQWHYLWDKGVFDDFGKIDDVTVKEYRRGLPFTFATVAKTQPETPQQGVSASEISENIQETQSETVSGSLKRQQKIIFKQWAEENGYQPLEFSRDFLSFVYGDKFDARVRPRATAIIQDKGGSTCIVEMGRMGDPRPFERFALPMNVDEVRQALDNSETGKILAQRPKFSKMLNEMPPEMKAALEQIDKAFQEHQKQQGVSASEIPENGVETQSETRLQHLLAAKDSELREADRQVRTLLSWALENGFSLSNKHTDTETPLDRHFVFEKNQFIFAVNDTNDNLFVAIAEEDSKGEINRDTRKTWQFVFAEQKDEEILATESIFESYSLLLQKRGDFLQQISKELPKELMKLEQGISASEIPENSQETQPETVSGSIETEKQGVSASENSDTTPNKAKLIENMNLAQLDIEITKTKEKLSKYQAVIDKVSTTQSEKAKAFPLGVGRDGWSKGRAKQAIQEIEKETKQAVEYADAVKNRDDLQNRLNRLEKAKERLNKPQQEQKEQQNKPVSTLKWRQTQKERHTEKDGYTPKKIESGDFAITGSDGLYSLYFQDEKIGTYYKLSEAKTKAEQIKETTKNSSGSPEIEKQGTTTPEISETVAVSHDLSGQPEKPTSSVLTKEQKAEPKAAKDALSSAKKELKAMRDELENTRPHQVSYYLQWKEEKRQAISEKQSEVRERSHQYDELSFAFKTQTGEITDLEKEILTARLSGSLKERFDIAFRELKTQKKEIGVEYDALKLRIENKDFYEFEIQSVMQDAVGFYSGSRGMATLYHKGKPLPLTTDREKAIAYLLQVELPTQLHDELGKPFNALARKIKKLDYAQRYIENANGALGRYYGITQNDIDPYIDLLEDTENQLMKGSIEERAEINLTYDINTEYGKQKIRELFYNSRHDQAQAELFEKVFAMAQKLNVEVRHALRDPHKTFSKRNATTTTLGWYQLNENSARVKHGGKIDTEEKGEVLLHELVHSVTSRAMLLKEQGHTELLNDAQIKAIDEIEKIYKIVLDKAEELGFEKYQKVTKDDKETFVGDYGLKNSHEFIAELANPVFREKLKQVAVFEDTVKAMTEVATGVEKTETAYDRLTVALYQIMDNYEPDFGAKYEQANYGNIKMNDIFRQPEKENQMEQTTQTAEKGGIFMAEPVLAEKTAEEMKEIINDLLQQRSEQMGNKHLSSDIATLMVYVQTDNPTAEETQAVKDLGVVKNFVENNMQYQKWYAPTPQDEIRRLSENTVKHDMNGLPEKPVHIDLDTPYIVAFPDDIEPNDPNANKTLGELMKQDDGVMWDAEFWGDRVGTGEMTVSENFITQVIETQRSEVMEEITTCGNVPFTKEHIEALYQREPELIKEVADDYAVPEIKALAKEVVQTAEIGLKKQAFNNMFALLQVSDKINALEKQLQKQPNASAVQTELKELKHEQDKLEEEYDKITNRAFDAGISLKKIRNGAKRQHAEFSGKPIQAAEVKQDALGQLEKQSTSMQQLVDKLDKAYPINKGEPFVKLDFFDDSKENERSNATLSITATELFFREVDKYDKRHTIDDYAFFDVKIVDFDGKDLKNGSYGIYRTQEITENHSGLFGFLLSRDSVFPNPQQEKADEDLALVLSDYLDNKVKNELPTYLEKIADHKALPSVTGVVSLANKKEAQAIRAFNERLQEHLQNKEVERDAFGLPETAKTLSLQEQALADGKRLQQADEKVKSAEWECAKKPNIREPYNNLQAAIAERDALNEEIKPRVQAAMDSGKSYIVDYSEDGKPFELVVTQNGNLKMALGSYENEPNHNHLLSTGNGEVALNAEQRSTPERTAEVLKYNFKHGCIDIGDKLALINYPNADKVFSENQIKDTLNKALKSSFKEDQLAAIHSPRMKDEWLKSVGEKHNNPEVVAAAHNVLAERQALSSPTLSDNLEPENHTANKGGFSLPEHEEEPATVADDDGYERD